MQVEEQAGFAEPHSSSTIGWGWVEVGVKTLVQTKNVGPEKEFGPKKNLVPPTNVGPKKN